MAKKEVKAPKKIGKYESTADRNGATFDLYIMRLGPDEVAIQWSAVYSSTMLPKWRNYKRRHPGNFATAREARAFAKAFIQKVEAARTIGQATS